MCEACLAVAASAAKADELLKHFRMQRPSDEFDSFADARPWDDSGLLVYEVDAVVLHGRNRRQRLPHRDLARAHIGWNGIASKLEDHLGTFRQDQLGRCLNGFLFDVAKDVLSTSRADHVVDESDPAAGINASE